MMMVKVEVCVPSVDSPAVLRERWVFAMNDWLGVVLDMWCLEERESPRHKWRLKGGRGSSEYCRLGFEARATYPLKEPPAVSAEVAAAALEAFRRQVHASWVSSQRKSRVTVTL